MTATPYATCNSENSLFLFPFSHFPAHSTFETDTYHHYCKHPLFLSPPCLWPQQAICETAPPPLPPSRDKVDRPLTRSCFSFCLIIVSFLYTSMSGPPSQRPPVPPPVSQLTAQQMARRLKTRLRLARCAVERELGHSLAAIVPPARSHSMTASPRPQPLGTARSQSASFYTQHRHVPVRNHSASTANPFSAPSPPPAPSTPDQDAEVAHTILMLATPPIVRSRQAQDESPSLRRRRRLDFTRQREHRRVVSDHRFETPNLSQIASLPQRPANTKARRCHATRSSSPAEAATPTS